MVLFADKIPDSLASGFNIFIALMLFLVMPVIITLAYKYNQKMDAASGSETGSRSENTAEVNETENKEEE